MKKTVCIIIALYCMFFAGCNSLSHYEEKVSEFRDEVLTGGCDVFTATALSGYHETPFEIDGVSNEKADFTLLSIEPTVYDEKAEYFYSFTIEDVEYSGTMVKHPFENTYSAEVEARATGELAVLINGREVVLKSVKTEDYIDADKAFEISAKRLKGTDVLKGEYEIYIRLIENPINASGGYFWYVAFVDGEDTVAALIHPITFEILAVRE